MDNRTFLSLSASDALAQMLGETYAGQDDKLAMIDQWVTFQVDAANSQYIMTSRAISKNGLIGQYTGEVVFPYTKRSLNNLLPYPLVYSLEYPTTLTRLATFMEDTYGIVIEDGEFSVDNNSVTGALSGTDAIDAAPDAVYGRVVFRALATSGRFAADSTFSVRLTSPGQPVPLASVLRFNPPMDLHLLTDH